MPGWTPARPERAAPPLRGDEQPVLSVEPAPPHTTRRATPRRAHLWDRLSPARRILVGFLAVALVIGTLALAGTTTAPRYSDLAPWRTDRVVDVRAVPTVAGWSVDLAREVLPGVPVRCIGFSVSSPTGRLVLIRGVAPSLGSSPSCTPGTRQQVASTIALLDTATGTVEWRADLERAFPTGGGSISIGESFVVARVSRVLVQLTVDGTYTLASLDLSSGNVVGRAQVGPNQVGQGLSVQGSLVLYNGTTSREGSSEWTLLDVRRLAQPVWTRILPDATAPILLDGALFADIDGVSTRVDGSSGRATRLGDGSVDLSNTIVDGDAVYATRRITSGTIVSAWGASGRSLWSRSGIGELTGLSRDCVIASLPGTSALTCLDKSTGRSRWSTPVNSQAYAYYVPGQTSNDVPVYRSYGNRAELLMLDGADGRELYRVDLLPSSGVVAASRTTAYIEIASDSGSATGLTAFDTATGRVLWRAKGTPNDDLQLWGGHVVRLTGGTVATELTDPPAIVLGD